MRIRSGPTTAPTTHPLKKAILAGQRVLHLTVGVDPARFDSLVEQLRGVARLLRIRVHKVDKTNEYKTLTARQASLLKARSSLKGLKGQGGTMDNLITLEQRILEVEGQIQSLGVQLGEFDAENEFCTVKLALSEARPVVAPAGIPLLRRAKVAFEWSVAHYLKLLGIALFGMVALLLSIIVAERLGLVAH